jgi:hypothetical protein
MVFYVPLQKLAKLSQNGNEPIFSFSLFFVSRLWFPHQRYLRVKKLTKNNAEESVSKVHYHSEETLIVIFLFLTKFILWNNLK